MKKVMSIVAVCVALVGCGGICEYEPAIQRAIHSNRVVLDDIARPLVLQYEQDPARRQAMLHAIDLADNSMTALAVALKLACTDPTDEKKPTE